MHTCIALLCALVLLLGCGSPIETGTGGSGGEAGATCQDGACDGKPSDDCRLWFCGGATCEYVNAENGTACEPNGASAGGGSGGTDGAGDTGGSGGAAIVCGFDSQCDPNDGPIKNKAVCDDGFDKTLDRCIPTTPCGGVCAHVGAQCDSLDSIDVQQDVCNDNNPCTADRCMEQNACFNGVLNDGAECPGGVCVGGSCSG